MTSVLPNVVSGENPESMPTVADYLAADRGTPSPPLFERSTLDLGNAPVAKDCYTSKAYHDVEVERLWKKTWQMACRENDIPAVGDRLVYDIVGQSVIIVRVAPDAIRAYHNVCRHRGNRLLEEGCPPSAVIECSFHGWSWNLDGSLRRVPCRWDFPEVDDAKFGLPECRVGRWNGMVFVNLDSEAEPFDDHIGDTLRRHFECWPRERAWKAGHVGKVLPCNWKVAAEAFLEVYHTVRTHADSLTFTADCNAQYDFWGPHLRLISCFGAPSPHVGDGVDDQTTVETMVGALLTKTFGEDITIPVLKDGERPRDVMSDLVRQGIRERIGVDLSGASDAEVLDIIQYYVFPNLWPWGGYAFPLVFRVRPNGDDHESSIFEMMVLVPLPPGIDPPKDMPLRMTPSDEPWAEAFELGALGRFLDQDMVNLNKIQRGLNSDGLREVVFANAQERNIRNFHHHLTDRLERGQ